MDSISPSGLTSALLDQIALGVAIYRLDDIDDPESLWLVYRNPASEAITGLDLTVEVGKRLVEVAPGVRDTGLLDSYAEVIRNGLPLSIGPVPHGAHENEPSGAYLARVLPLRDQCMGIVYEDITDYQHAYEQARRAKGLLRSVLNASPDGVMAFEAIRDDEGRICDFRWLLVNSRAGEIVGRDAPSLYGEQLLEVFPGNRDAGLFDAYVQVVETGARFETVVRYPHDGFETSFRVVATPIPSEDGFTVTFSEIIDATHDL